MAEKKIIRSRSKCDMLADEITNQIISGVYKPGDKLPPEGELVEEFGVSRVTVRESLKKLSSMGLVSIYQGDGTFVSTFNLQSFMRPLYPLMVLSDLSLEQLYDARLYVEVGTAGLAAKNADGKQIAQLRATLRTMDNAVMEGDVLAFTQLDWSFHLQLGEASHNEVLLSAYMMINDMLKHYIKQTNYRTKIMGTSLVYHKKIVDALEARDSAGAESLMREHINTAKQALMSALETQKEGSQEL